MDHPSRLRENMGGWGLYDRGCARDRGEYRQNRGNARYENQWNNRNNYRQDMNRPYNQEERPQRGYGRPSYQPEGPNVYHQEDRAEAQSLNNFNDRARPKDKNHDDHMRDVRQDRWRTLEDKNVDVGARDSWKLGQFGSPDRSLPEHCIQDTLSLSADAITQNQSKQVIRANQGQTSELFQLAKVGKEKNVKSTIPNEDEEFPNSSDFVYDLEDSTSSSCTVREDLLGAGQRLEFDQNVKVVKVPIGCTSLVYKGKGKKKKSKRDREKEEGTKTQKKTGVDTTCKIKDDYPTTPPISWDEDEKFENAIQHQDAEEDFVDAHISSPDVILESNEETITIDEPVNSISAIDYLMEKDVVAVHVEASKDGLQRIACITEDKSYNFDVENNPDLMTSGKVAEFFNWNLEPKGPTKVFHGLDSKMCAVFFDKYDIILDGTKIYDLKIAYDMMREYGLGDIIKLKKTGFSPDCIPVDSDNVTAVCLTYIKAYQYFSQEIIKEMKDYKKHLLFEMVRAEIDIEKLKTAKERKKKECKAANIVRLSHSDQTSNSKKQKRKMDFPVRQLASELKEKEITNEREEKLEIIPSSDSSSSQNFTASKQLPKNCNSLINLQAASSYPSLNNNLQQEFHETRQMARQCATQKSQEEQCQVIAVVKHESVEFPDGRRYTCKSTVVPDPVIVEGKSTSTQTESDKCKDVGVQCEIIDWNKYQKMIELAEVVLR